MSIKIKLERNIAEKSIKNYVLFCDENFKIQGLDKLSLANQSRVINKTISNNKLKDETFLSFNINPNQKIILVKLKQSSSSLENEEIGAKYYNFIKKNSIFNSTFFENNIIEASSKKSNFTDEFFHGVQLRSYEFNKYKSKRKIDFYVISILSKKNLLR